MGILTSLMGKRSSLSDASMVRMLMGGGSVTPESAMRTATVFACVRVLAESIGMLPLEMRTAETRGTRRATEHSVYPVLHSLANPEMTAAEMRMCMQGHLATWGNAYAQKIPDQRGRWIELWPLRPDSMETKRGPDGSLIYEYREQSGNSRVFMNWEVMHLRGLGYDGLQGYAPISMARRTFAAKQRLEEYQEAFYENGARPGMVLRHPGKLSDKAYDRLLKTWENRHRGAANVNKVALLEEGVGAENIGIPQADAQFLETQKYTRTEIAGLFRVPGHMINDLERATFSNIEQMSLEFVMFSLMPWLVIWEQGGSRDLLTPAERKAGYYLKHKIQGLLRGDNASRSAFYASALQWGYMSINDVRELEDMNPVDGGDTHFVPLNMVPLTQAANPAAVALTPAGASAARSIERCTCGGDHRGDEHRADPGQDDDDHEAVRASRVEMARAMYPILDDVATRMVRREVRDVRRAMLSKLGTRSTEFETWLREFYDEFNGVLSDAFRAVLLSYARQAMLAAAAELGKPSKGLTDDLRQFASEYLDVMANQWTRSSRLQLEALLEEPDPITAIEERLAGWESTRPGKIADQHSFEGLNALVIAAYGAYQVVRIMWLAAGKSCGFCQSLSGKTIGIETYFIPAGGAIDAGDGSPPMQVRRNTRHGPLHGGCDCVVRAA